MLDPLIECTDASRTNDVGTPKDFILCSPFQVLVQLIILLAQFSVLLLLLSELGKFPVLIVFEMLYLLMQRNVFDVGANGFARSSAQTDHF